MLRKIQVALLVPLALGLLFVFYRSGSSSGSLPPSNEASTRSSDSSFASTNSQSTTVEPSTDFRDANSPTTDGQGSENSNDTSTDSPRFSDADFAAHVEQLKKKLPSEDFTIIIQPPFVVIGDEPADDVKGHSEHTVKWAVDKLKQEYFTQDPKEILDIWLFKDAASYERNAQQLFGDKPTTPYGYYSIKDKSLVMNISTGGGTLVHEIVHPFVEANFPNCPPWLNEGLGSLYEQSGELNGRIHGFTNWRLPGLQASIKARTVPSFRTLTGLNEPEFYSDDRGTHYAQARYLLYYLQQKGLLTKYYRDFFARRKVDPTGYQTLRRILGKVDMRVFKRKWERYVLGLSQGYEVEVR